MRAIASGVESLTRKLRNSKSLMFFGPSGGPSKAFIPAEASMVYRSATSRAFCKAHRSVLFSFRVAALLSVGCPVSRSREEPGLPPRGLAVDLQQGMPTSKNQPIKKMMLIIKKVGLI